MEKQPIDKVSAISDLINVIKALRGENGCMWDKKQTPKSMSVYLIEEIYELVDAIESKSHQDICEELGDVLFHILFIAQLFEEESLFDIRDVARVNTDKMIRRHPHVFGNERVTSVDDIKKNWHKIKLKEKNHEKKNSVLDSVPISLPSLMRAYRISERAARTGFDWNNISDVIKKSEEEWDEFKSELSAISKDKNVDDNAAMEFGDTLFTLVNVARFAQIHPETALKDAIKKFEKRFKHIENIISNRGEKIESLSATEMDRLWEEAKKSTDL